MPKPKGMHHLGLATHDMDATLDFYESVLGFRAVVCEMIDPPAGGAVRHAFLDCGAGQLLAFMEFNQVPGVPDFAADINTGLGLPSLIYHFAFHADDEAELDEHRDHLVAKGVEVTPVVDHHWCKSIYFKDPNGIQLEYCCLTQTLGESHVAGRTQESWVRWTRSRDD